MNRRWTMEEAEAVQRRRRQRELAALVQPRPTIAERARALYARLLRVNFKCLPRRIRGRNSTGERI